MKIFGSPESGYCFKSMHQLVVQYHFQIDATLGDPKWILEFMDMNSNSGSSKNLYDVAI